MVAVVIEVEYATDSEEEAKAFAMHDASRIFQQDRVLAVAADLESTYIASVISSSGKRLPITERYLDDE